MRRRSSPPNESRGDLPRSRSPEGGRRSSPVRMSQGPRGQSRHSSLRKADRDEIAISRGSWRVHGSGSSSEAQGTAPCGDGKPSGRVCLRARVRERRSCCGGRGCTRLQYGESAAAGARARPHALRPCTEPRFAKLACGVGKRATAACTDLDRDVLIWGAVVVVVQLLRYDTHVWWSSANSTDSISSVGRNVGSVAR